MKRTFDKVEHAGYFHGSKCKRSTLCQNLIVFTYSLLPISSIGFGLFLYSLIHISQQSLNKTKEKKTKNKATTTTTITKSENKKEKKNKLRSKCEYERETAVNQSGIWNVEDGIWEWEAYM